MDPMDHPADSGHNDDHNPGRASGEAQLKDIHEGHQGYQKMFGTGNSFATDKQETQMDQARDIGTYFRKNRDQ